MTSQPITNILATLDPRRIWRNFKTVGQWTSEPNTCIPCRARCPGCDVKWTESESQHVHMSSDRTGKLWYICDSCLLELENQDE